MKKIINITLRLFFVCLLCVSALAGVNAMTADRIAENEQKEIQNALQQLIPGAEYTQAELHQEEAFSRIDAVYTARKEGRYAGCVVIIRGRGYGGDIALRVGFDEKGVTTGIIVGSHSETPSLGAKITEDSFKKQFAGLNGKAVLKENITPITSATISSAGVVQAVNTARDYMEKYLGGNKG